MAKDQVIGVRDPHGVRPLVLGRLGDIHVLASETVALDIIGADYVRDIEPGEMVVLDRNGVQSVRPFQQTGSKFCIFEYIYFARPDSFMEGHSVYGVRKKIGAQLAVESHIDADLVIRCLIPVCQRRWAMRRKAAFPSIWASSATIMSAVPSFSRRTRSAAWA